MEHAELLDALKQIVFCEREAESAKIELALKSDFNVLDAFRMLDIRNIGSFTPNDLIDGLTANLGFTDFTQEDVTLFFRKFDRSRKGRISLSEYSSAYLPFSREYAQLVTDRGDYYSIRGFPIN